MRKNTGHPCPVGGSIQILDVPGKESVCAWSTLPHPLGERQCFLLTAADGSIVYRYSEQCHVPSHFQVPTPGGERGWLAMSGEFPHSLRSDHSKGTLAQLDMFRFRVRQTTSLLHRCLHSTASGRAMFLGLDSSTQGLKASIIEDVGKGQETVYTAALNYDKDLPHYGTKGGVHEHGGAHVTTPSLMVCFEWVDWPRHSHPRYSPKDWKWPPLSSSQRHSTIFSKRSMMIFLSHRFERFHSWLWLRNNPHFDTLFRFLSLSSGGI